jgi:hypothetical protein
MYPEINQIKSIDSDEKKYSANILTGLLLELLEILYSIYAFDEADV